MEKDEKNAEKYIFSINNILKSNLWTVVKFHHNSLLRMIILSMRTGIRGYQTYMGNVWMQFLPFNGTNTLPIMPLVGHALNIQVKPLLQDMLEPTLFTVTFTKKIAAIFQ